MKRIVFICIFLLGPFALFGQDTIDMRGGQVLYGLVVDGDTILVSTIEEVYVLPMHKFNSKREMRKYRRLVRNIKAVLPYAKLAKEKYDEVVASLEGMNSEKEKKEYMKQVEEELKEEFEDDLKKLTVTQGRLLLKLLDREIGETSYDLLKEFRGTFSAFFWQTLARIFGHNLKSEYEPDGEDRLLNEIVMLIENGQL
jgi:hypothetical protein